MASTAGPWRLHNHVLFFEVEAIKNLGRGLSRLPEEAFPPVETHTP